MNHVIRQKALEGLEGLGIKVDKRRNELSYCRNTETVISTDDSPVKCFVIPTDEELVITEDAHALMAGTYDVHTNFTYSFQSPDYVNRERAEAFAAEIKEKPHLEEIVASPHP